MDSIPHEVSRLSKSDERANIGGVLHSMGKLTSTDIQCVLQEQNRHRILFGQAAKRLGMIFEDDIQQALAHQFNYYYLQPGEGKFSNNLIAAYKPNNPQVEILRSVRTQLMENWFCAGHRELAVVSFNPNNEVRFFIANLALVFSQLCQRTLLMDANLRNPFQHEIFNLDAHPGLSEILANRAGMEACQRVDFFHNLSLLPAGTCPPNPLELVTLKAFRGLSQDLNALFDITLIDTPALSLGSDALVIGARVGGVLLVCKTNETSVTEVKTASARLRRAGAEIVGSVLICN